MSAPIEISVVLPTYNRADALRETFPLLLELDGIDEVVVVDDGSRDGAAAVLAGFDDPRVRVIRHEHNRGSPAARNTGLAAARGEWVLLTDDDCRLPRDYALVLRRAALEHGADLVSAPWLHTHPGDDLDAALEQGRRGAVDFIGPWSTHAAFPRAPVRTPFLPPHVLLRRAVAQRLRYHEGYEGNAWREETSFFIDAVEQGFVALLTPETASFQAGEWEGGQRRPRLSYEWWVARNNMRFLRRHGAWLRRQGYIEGELAAQVAFLISRWTLVARGFYEARRPPR